MPADCALQDIKNLENPPFFGTNGPVVRWLGKGIADGGAYHQINGKEPFHMADTKQTPNNATQHSNPADRSDRTAEQGGLNKDHAGKTQFQGDKDREKSAIGGREGNPGSHTGEQGRARNELDQKNKEPTGTQR
jgi:hypothetical protein